MGGGGTSGETGIIRMSNKSQQNYTELEELLQTLTVDQLRYVAVRPFAKTITEAAEEIGIARETIYKWDNKDDVDRAVTLMMSDGVMVAREMLRRNLPKAIKVKTEGLDLSDDRLKQSVATEIIEWLLGKAPQQVKADVTTRQEKPDFDSWDVDELQQFIQLLRKAGVEGVSEKEPD